MRKEKEILIKGRELPHFCVKCGERENLIKIKSYFNYTYWFKVIENQETSLRTSNFLALIVESFLLFLLFWLIHLSPSLEKMGIFICGILVILLFIGLFFHKTIGLYYYLCPKHLFLRRLAIFFRLSPFILFFLSIIFNKTVLFIAGIYAIPISIILYIFILHYFVYPLKIKAITTDKDIIVKIK